MITIIEEKIRLDGTRATWSCELLALEDGRHAVLRHVQGADRPVAGTDLILPAGTVTLAHYWADRPFNVYHWTLGDRTIAYYCNVAESTEISAARVAYLDLTLDVLLRPSGAVELLDEEEVPHDLAPRHRKTIADALERIVTNPRGLIAEIERESAPHRFSSSAVR